MACFGQGLAQVDGYHGEKQENGQNRGGKEREGCSNCSG